jgi:predicted Ser/Thr protein kinase
MPDEMSRDAASMADEAAEDAAMASTDQGTPDKGAHEPTGALAPQAGAVSEMAAGAATGSRKPRTTREAHEAADLLNSAADEAADEAALASTDRGGVEGRGGDRAADQGSDVASALDGASANDASSIAAGMAGMRPDAPTGAGAARASVFGKMFGDERAKYGKFVVRGRLGAGGMGVVYKARDTVLPRDVALKVFKVRAANRAVALAESEALARLSHPNVVPIYERGVAGDEVYVVMELVSGDTLQKWVEDRSWREILEAYQQAGKGLAAAHAEGLVHRDFKPTNAMVGHDARVRVIDFGLACEADDPTQPPDKQRGKAGTPFFMAPEIEAGGEVTPAADQYSFCVALADALSRARPPAPRRIAAVLARGRAPRPADRFASMDALLAELDRDPAKAWRRGAAVAAAVVLVGGLAYEVAEWRIRTKAEPDPCIAGPAKLDAVWSGKARAAALDRVASLGNYGKSLRPLLTHGLDDHRERWVDAYHAACVDQRSGTESDAQVDRRNICLARGRDELAAVRDLFARVAEGELEQLPRAVLSLPDPSVCAENSTLILAVDPPPAARSDAVAQVRTQIARARIAVGAGRYEDGLMIARAAAYDARNLDYTPVLAEALAVQGQARMNLPVRRNAVPILDEATRVALASKDDALAVETWARRAWAQATSVGPEAAAAGVEVIEAIAQRTPGTEFARALLYNNLAGVALSGSNRDQARVYAERAVAESGKVTGEGTVELLMASATNTLLLEDRRLASQRLAQIVAELTRLLGPDHPDALVVAWIRGMTAIEDLRGAVDTLLPACNGRAQYPGIAGIMDPCWTEIGLLRWDLEDRGVAVDALEQAVRAGDDGQESAGYLALFRGNAAEAIRQFTADIDAAPVALGAPWWKRYKQLVLRIGLGRAQRAARDLVAARRTLAAAVAELAPIVAAQPSSGRERRLGRARVELALAMIESGARSGEVAPVAEAGVAWLQRVGGSPAEIELLKAHAAR